MVLWAGLLLPGLGAAPFERAEIYFLDGARAMLERADYLVPHYQGEPFFDKPPLTYWLIAACFRLLGFTPEAGRLTSALAALVVLGLTVVLGTQLFDRMVGLLGAALLATTLAFVSFGRIAMSDMLLTLFSTLAVALASAAARAPAAPWVGPALGGALGLGFLAKGPVALLIPGLAMLLMWRPWRAGGRIAPRALVGGALAFALLGLGWFVGISLRLGASPLVHFFLRENLERFLGETYDSGRPFWYYGPAYLAAGLPWSLLLPIALVRAGRGPGPAAARLLAVWLGLALVPLALSRGKLDYYLLPLYPAASLLVARWLLRVPWNGFDRGWARGALLLTAPALVALGLLPERIDSGWLPSPLACQALQALAFGGAALALGFALRPSPRTLFGLLAGSAAGVGFLLASFFLPAFRAAQPNRGLVEDVRREARYRPEARVVACRDLARVERDILFFVRARVAERCDLWGLASSPRPLLFLLRPEERESLAAIGRFREVSRYRYLPATTLTLAGLIEPAAPGLVMLAANYPTADPAAETKRKRDRKRELRLLE